MTGDKNSIDFQLSSAHVVTYSTPAFRLADETWTFEGWIYPRSIASNTDHTIIGHCRESKFRQCLHLNIQNQTLYFGLYTDDFTGKQVLQNSRWYHFAFVMNCNTGQRWIYLDGQIDAMYSSQVCYKGTRAKLTFGSIFMNNYNINFNGLIDQISFAYRPKTSEEILDDATLVAYFSFDNDTVTDQGPLALKSRLFGNITLSVHGRHFDALLINNYSSSYLLIENLVRLGESSYNYSFALWIKPNEIRQSTLIHVSRSSYGSNGWCLPFIGLNSTGYLSPKLWPIPAIDIVGPLIKAGVWTHIVLTYSSVNGFRLYVNGSLYDSINGTYTASGSPVYMRVGSLNPTVQCHGSRSIGGQYHGFIDELRIYSRELVLSEIQSLAK